MPVGAGVVGVGEREVPVGDVQARRRARRDSTRAAVDRRQQHERRERGRRRARAPRPAAAAGPGGPRSRRSDTVPVRPQLAQEQPGDEEAREHEEDVDADVAAGHARHARVVQHDEQDRDRPQPLDVGAGSRLRRGDPARLRDRGACAGRARDTGGAGACAAGPPAPRGLRRHRARAPAGAGGRRSRPARGPRHELPADDGRQVAAGRPPARRAGRRTAPAGPSHSAAVGSGWTSTMTPSAPTAIAARVSGTTRSRLPPECDGSMITGRCDRPCSTGTADTSSVLRVPVSKVRMPRSQSTMSRLPRCATYSAAISHSSYVAVMPRLSITGRPAEPTACSSAKFCMLRVPTCSMSAHSATSGTSAASTTSVTTGRPVSCRTSARIRRPRSPSPWNAYGRGARLVRPAPQQGGARALGHPRGGQRLLRGLDRARAGDEGEGARADRHAADLDGAGLGVVLAADELVGLAHPDDLADPGHRPQVERLELHDVADQPDDRAVDTPADEGGAAGLLDAGDDGVDLVGGCAGAHDDDHEVLPSTRRVGTTRAPGRCPGLAVGGARYTAPDRETRAGNA